MVIPTLCTLSHSHQLDTYKMLKVIVHSCHILVVAPAAIKVSSTEIVLEQDTTQSGAQKHDSRCQGRWLAVNVKECASSPLKAICTFLNQCYL